MTVDWQFVLFFSMGTLRIFVCTWRLVDLRGTGSAGAKPVKYASLHVHGINRLQEKLLFSKCVKQNRCCVSTAGDS